VKDRILALLQNRKKGLSLKILSRELRLNAKERKQLRDNLKKLEGQGIIRRVRNTYFLPPKSNILKGRFVTSKPGYGFVAPEGESLEDIFIPARFAAGAMQGDLVEVLYKERGKKGKPEGRVLRILKKERKRLMGLYQERAGQPFFLPFDSPAGEEVPLASKEKLSPLSGMIVEVDRDSLHLIAVLGMPDDPGVDAKVVIRKYNLALKFSSETLKEAEETSPQIPVEERSLRKDYRTWTIVTIDGENAQDFDDAVSVRKLDNGHFLLGVHIADVSHYVNPGTSVDKEAFGRGTSVYFPDLTLPMLPEKLSNDICSLKPREERLTFSVLLEIDEKGNVLGAEFHPGLIQTAARMTYTSVFNIFEGDEEERQKFSYLVPDLLLMRDLARVLRKKREEKGSLDFDILEPELVYREGKLYSVASVERNEAHQVIEEFMIAANEAVAAFLSNRNIPSLFRVHPPPSLSDLEDLRETLTHFGLLLPKASKVEAKDLQSVLEKVKGTKEEKFINVLVLRALKLAVYSGENSGHYGLAKKEYTHFTSPIRRYPDLIVHRILKQALRGEKAKIPSLASIALHSSRQERNADEAERDLVEWRIFRFLRGMLGEEFEGIIVDITQAGLVVELDDYSVDGVVLYADLDGDYYFKKSNETLMGKRRGRVFELGERIQVILVSVDPLSRRMNFILKSDEEKTP
jgi:ribonuclease R